MLREKQTTVQSLWIGKRLGTMERLTLRSFLDHGHRFILWVYDPIDDVYPEVDLRDASEIINRERVFCYIGGDHPGSYAGFSDLFRYKLLFERGGWWVDMDVACLKRFDIASELVLRPHQTIPCCGNILRAPVGSELMRRCFAEAEKVVTAKNDDWLLPLRILNHYTQELGLHQNVAPENWFGTDADEHWKPFLSPGNSPPDDRYAIHWCNEWMKKCGYDKSVPMEGSFYHFLLRRHGILR